MTQSHQNQQEAVTPEAVQNNSEQLVEPERLDDIHEVQQEREITKTRIVFEEDVCHESGSASNSTPPLTTEPREPRMPVLPRPAREHEGESQRDLQEYQTSVTEQVLQPVSQEEPQQETREDSPERAHNVARSVLHGEPRPDSAGNWKPPGQNFLLPTRSCYATLRFTETLRRTYGTARCCWWPGCYYTGVDGE